MLNELCVQLFIFDSFVSFSITAEFTNHDTSYWAQELSLGSSIWIMGPHSSDQMRKAMHCIYAKVRVTSAMVMDVTTPPVGIVRFVDTQE